MAYRNFNTQVRPNTTKDFYWDVRPHGNPHPADCTTVEGFLYYTITFSDDWLTQTVETVWQNKEAYLSTLPPDVNQQPDFQQWHDDNGLTFSGGEDENFEHDPARVGDNQIINPNYLVHGHGDGNGRDV